MPRSTAPLMLAGLLLTAGCATSDAGSGADTAVAPSAAPQGTPAEELRLGYFPNLTHATAVYGVAEGVFEETLGQTTLTAQTFNAGPAAVEALFAGAIDATYIGPNPAINAFVKSKGEAVRIVAGATSGGASLVVKPEITEVSQLRGASIGTPQTGNTQDIALRHFLGENGFAVDERGAGDVTIVAQENAQNLALFQSGDIDGAWVPEPWASRMVLEGGGSVLVDEKELWPGGRFVTTHLLVRTEFLAEHPETVRALIEGSVESNRRIHDDEDNAKQVINAALGELSGKPLSSETLDRAFAGLEVTDDPVATSLKTSAEHAFGTGLVEEADLTGIYDLSLLREVLGEDVDDAGLGVIMTVVEHVESTPATTAAAVRLAAVSKRFGTGPIVLDQVSLDVAPGEFVCLLGASGCGKSTLLNLVAGLDEPSSGTVVVDGARPSLMFQEPALLPWLTAAQNVELALRLKGVDKKERRARAHELLALVRLQDAGAKRVHELSGGMRQRVAMARALAQDSPVLLMDEPFAALDAITRDALHDELVRLWTEQGLTVLFVTHNVREAVRLGQRVILLSSRPGRVAKEYAVEVGQPRRIESPQVAQLSMAITDDLRAEIRRHASTS